jgi:hypothetical protein
MKMDCFAWKTDVCGDYSYNLQIDDIKHGDKSEFKKLFNDWNIKASGWNVKQNTEVKILVKSFQSEKEWIEWAKKCPIKIIEVKYRSGKEIKIQRSCKTRKKRASNAKTSST